jgi:hypothetical protein
MNIEFSFLLMKLLFGAKHNVFDYLPNYETTVTHLKENRDEFT